MASARVSPPSAAARFSRRGGRRDASASRRRHGVARQIAHLKRRGEFLKVAGAGRKFVAPGLILQVLRRPTEPPSVAAESASDSAPATAADLRLGLTASRKLGIAVLR